MTFSLANVIGLMMLIVLYMVCMVVDQWSATGFKVVTLVFAVIIGASYLMFC